MRCKKCGNGHLELRTHRLTSLNIPSFSSYYQEIICERCGHTERIE